MLIKSQFKEMQSNTMGKAFQQKQETVICTEATVRRKDRKSSGDYKPQCPSTPR